MTSGHYYTACELYLEAARLRLGGHEDAAMVRRFAAETNVQRASDSREWKVLAKFAEAVVGFGELADLYDDLPAGEETSRLSSERRSELLGGFRSDVELLRNRVSEAARS